jgi:hypothetical protein
MNCVDETRTMCDLTSERRKKKYRRPFLLTHMVAWMKWVMRVGSAVQLPPHDVACTRGYRGQGLATVDETGAHA